MDIFTEKQKEELLANARSTRAEAVKGEYVARLYRKPVVKLIKRCGHGHGSCLLTELDPDDHCKVYGLIDDGLAIDIRWISLDLLLPAECDHYFEPHLCLDGYLEEMEAYHDRYPEKSEWLRAV